MSELALTGWALVIAVVALIGLWVALGAASRLDRLHKRVHDSRVTLDAQLVRRATAALDLAVADVLDPASSVVVADAAREALDHVPRAPAESPDGGPGSRAPGAAPGAASGDPPPHVGAPGEAADLDRAMAESELSQVLRAALGDPADRASLMADPGARELVDRLDREWYRVQLARRFHNDAVVQVRRIRAKGYVRLLRLAGRAPVPQTFEMDDETSR